MLPKDERKGIGEGRGGEKEGKGVERGEEREGGREERGEVGGAEMKRAGGRRGRLELS